MLCQLSYASGGLENPRGWRVARLTRGLNSHPHLEKYSTVRVETKTTRYFVFALDQLLVYKIRLKQSYIG
jgi:hypothetical protein